MKESKLYALWGAFYILCGVLGFIRQPNGFVMAVLVLLAVGFFVPGFLLLYQGVQEKNVKKLRTVRNISLIWLALALALLVVNFLSAGATELVGDLIYGLLVMFTAPMCCGQFWIMSLFLWACLLMTSLSCLKKVKCNQ